MTTKENRRAPRSDHDTVLEMFDSSGHLLQGIGRLLNFSTVGACFSSTDVLKKGDPIQARIRLTREGTYEVTGHVVWARQKTNTTLYGIAFDKMDKVPQHE